MAADVFCLPTPKSSFALLLPFFTVGLCKQASLRFKGLWRLQAFKTENLLLCVSLLLTQLIVFLFALSIFRFPRAWCIMY